MPKKKINVIIHHEEDINKENLLISKAISGWYTDLVKKTLDDSKLSNNEKEIFIDKLIKKLQDKENCGLISLL